MSAEARGLFHTRVAPLLNLHRVLPAEVVRDVAALDVPLNSREGFVRQVLGDAIVDHYAHFYEIEQAAFDRAVTDWERWRYFERI